MCDSRLWVMLGFAVACTGSAMGEELKVSRVALFSSGVGYFECAANVEGTQQQTLRFRVEQINDILKSMVLRDLDGGSISPVQYASRDPVEKTLKSFSVDISRRPTLGQLLDDLRGVSVEVSKPDGTKQRGLILGVEKRTTKTEVGLVEDEVLTVVAEEGLRTFLLRDLAGLKILDERTDGELTKALQTVAAARDSDKKAVTLEFAGQGKRRVRVGYLLETPIWKTSYRLVLADDKKPYLQGWAIVENTTEQDWEGVQLALVSGRPISFRMDLYQPLYLARPMEELELYASLRPPSIEAGMDRPAAAPAPMAAARATRKSRGASKDDRRLEGFAGGGNIFGGSGGAAAGEAEDMAEMTLQNTGVQSSAEAAEAGELFQYAIGTPVTLARQRSAMLPIVGADIEGHKLSLYNPATHPKHPVNALKLKNTTGLQLTQGPVTLFDANIYAGDAKLPDLRPDEERMVAYALDLAVDVDVKSKPVPEELTQVWISKGTLWRKRKQIDERTYTLKNKADAARTVLVEVPLSEPWKLVEPKEVEERTSSWVRLKSELPAKQTQALPVRLEQSIEEAVIVGNLPDSELDYFVQSRVVSAELKAALSKMRQLRAAVADTQNKIRQLEKEIGEIEAEQGRIRENMKVVDKGKKTYLRYEEKLDEQETKIEGLRAQKAELEKQRDRQQRALEEFLASLEVK